MRIQSSEIRPTMAKKTSGYKSRIYVFPGNETILENFENRRSRPFNAYRKVALEALENHFIDVSKLKLKWSQEAGCSCGCSPGFIVEGWDAKLNKNDMFIQLQ